MNLYIRYFDDERVVTNVEDALQFIASIPGFNMTPVFIKEFTEYAEGPSPFPKRYKVRPRLYFIVIKTNANTMEEFKANGRNKDGNLMGESVAETPRERMPIANLLTKEQPGWYEATVNFKRVVVKPQTGKCQYIDTEFSARIKAYSGLDCYNRLIDHLRTRSDIDPRSQFPSAKGKNYKFKYLGLKPYKEVAV